MSFGKPIGGATLSSPQSHAGGTLSLGGQWPVGSCGVGTATPGARLSPPQVRGLAVAPARGEGAQPHLFPATRKSSLATLVLGGEAYTYQKLHTNPAAEVGTTPPVVAHSHILDVFRSEEARHRNAQRTQRIQERSTTQRVALDRLLRSGEDAEFDALYVAFRQHRNPQDVYFKLSSSCRRLLDSNFDSSTCSTTGGRALLVSAGTQVSPDSSSDIAPSLPTDSVNLQQQQQQQQQQFGPPPRQRRRKPLLLSWPPLLANLRHSGRDEEEGDKSPCVQELRGAVVALHAQMQREVHAERRRRLREGERVSVPLLGTTKVKPSPTTRPTTQPTKLRF